MTRRNEISHDLVLFVVTFVFCFSAKNSYYFTKITYKRNRYGSSCLKEKIFQVFHFEIFIIKVMKILKN